MLAIQVIALAVVADAAQVAEKQARSNLAGLHGKRRDVFLHGRLEIERSLLVAAARLRQWSGAWKGCRCGTAFALKRRRGLRDPIHRTRPTTPSSRFSRLSRRFPAPSARSAGPTPSAGPGPRRNPVPREAEPAPAQSGECGVESGESLGQSITRPNSLRFLGVRPHFREGSPAWRLCGSYTYPYLARDIHSCDCGFCWRPASLPECCARNRRGSRSISSARSAPSFPTTASSAMDRMPIPAWPVCGLTATTMHLPGGRTARPSSPERRRAA